MTSWRDQAACRDTEPDIWFPTPNEDRSAQRLCLGCPSITDCAADALRTGDQYGIRAGIIMDPGHVRRDRAALQAVIAGQRPAPVAPTTGAKPRRNLTTDQYSEIIRAWQQGFKIRDIAFILELPEGLVGSVIAEHRAAS